MLPACRKLYPANDFYYIHDEAQSHISKTIQLLERGSRTSLRYQGPMATLLPRLKSAWLFLLDPGEKESVWGKAENFQKVWWVEAQNYKCVAKLLWPANYSTCHTAVQRKIESCHWSSWLTNQANFLIYLLSILIEIERWLLNSHRATWNLKRLCFSHSTLKNLLS